MSQNTCALIQNACALYRFVVFLQNFLGSLAVPVLFLPSVAKKSRVCRVESWFFPRKLGYFYLHDSVTHAHFEGWNSLW